MKITETRIRLIQGKKRLRAIVSITLDGSLILNDIKVIQAAERLCVEFPKNLYAIPKGQPEFIVVPTSMKVRKEMEAVILKAYTNIQARKH